MTSLPRIYLYKISFIEVPYFYYGIHKENYVFSAEHKEKLRKSTTGRKWWNNGFHNKLQHEKPSPEWKLGLITSTRKLNA